MRYGGAGRDHEGAEKSSSKLIKETTK